MYTLMETHVVAIKPRKVHGKNRKAVCINLNLQFKQILARTLFTNYMNVCLFDPHVLPTSDRRSRCEVPRP